MAKSNAASELEVPVPELSYFEKDTLLAPPVIPDGALPPPPPAPRRLNIVYRFYLWVGNLSGILASVVMGVTTTIWGTFAGYRDKIWTNWYRRQFVLGILIQVAAYERQRISERTRAALQVAKERGTKLGNPEGFKAFKGRQGLGIARAAVSHKARADEWAEKRRGLLEELLAAGLNLSAMARELTARKITTRRGGQWHARTVANLLSRLELVAA